MKSTLSAFMMALLLISISNSQVSYAHRVDSCGNHDWGDKVLCYDRELEFSVGQKLLWSVEGYEIDSNIPELARTISTIELEFMEVPNRLPPTEIINNDTKYFNILATSTLKGTGEEQIESISFTFFDDMLIFPTKLLLHTENQGSHKKINYFEDLVDVAPISEDSWVTGLPDSTFEISVVTTRSLVSSDQESDLVNFVQVDSGTAIENPGEDERLWYIEKTVTRNKDNGLLLYSELTMSNQNGVVGYKTKIKYIDFSHDGILSLGFGILGDKVALALLVSILFFSFGMFYYYTFSKFKT